jgi:predicted kinase
MNSLIIVRGLPGSGKTTFANMMAGIYPVYSADDYFYNEKGEYIWDPKKLRLAHELCFNRTKESMIRYESMIFVANTFVTEREITPYIELASQFGYKVFTIIVENRHGSKSVHGVPDETMKTFKSKFNIIL